MRSHSRLLHLVSTPAHKLEADDPWKASRPVWSILEVINPNRHLSLADIEALRRYKLKNLELETITFYLAVYLYNFRSYVCYHSPFSDAEANITTLMY